MNFSNNKFNKKILSHAMMLVSISSVVTLTACQSTPVQSNLATPSNPALTPSQNAHRLMTDMMIHRFDKAYDFEKTTQYHAYPLYAENDLEKNDQSLWFTLLKGYSAKRAKVLESDDTDKDVELSPAEQKCEDDYENAEDKNLDDYINEKISETTYDKRTAKNDANLEKCLDKLSEDSQAQRAVELDKQLAKEEKAAIESYSREVSAFAKTETSADDTSVSSSDRDEKTTETSENSPNDELTPSKYQIMVERLINKLNALDEHPTPKDKTDEEDDELKDIVENSDDYFIKKLEQLKLKPQQIQVLNDSYLAPNLISYKGSFNPATNQYSTVYEESLHRPFVDTYRRVPVLVDFNEMSITAEPDAVLPFIGMITLASDDKQNMLKSRLTELEGKSVKFVLPEKIKQKIPLNLLKDTLIKSIGQSYADLPAERFSDVTLDNYAKSIHASRAIKLNLTHQDIGYLLGRTMKYWAIELNNLTAQHPEYLTNRDDFKASLDLLNALNRHYRAEDLAKIAQIVEAVLPLSYNGYNYYYFDSQNNLVGYRKNTDYSSSLFGARMTSTTTSKLTYSARKDNSHAFYQPKTAEIIDGNALVKDLANNSKLQKEARDARWGYTSEDLSDNEQSYSSAAEKADKAADKAVAFYYAENLKFTKKMGCQKFSDSNEDALIAIMPYRYDKNFSTKLPQVQKFIDTCPAQVEKLETLQINYDQAAENAARAAKQAADMAKNAPRFDTYENMTITSKTYTQDYAQVKRLLNTAKTIKFDPKQSCEGFIEDNKAPLVQVFMDYSVGEKMAKDYPNIAKFVTACPAQADNLKAVADVEKAVLEPASEPKPTIDAQK